MHEVRVRPRRWLRVLIGTGAACSLSLAVVTTVDAYGNYVAVVPQPVAPGQMLSVQTDSWETNAPLAFYWNGDVATPIATTNAVGTAATVTFTVPPEPDGGYDLAACEAAPGPQSGCMTVPVHFTVQVLNPTPPPTPTPTAAPTPVVTPTPAAHHRPAPTRRPVPTAATTAAPAPSAIFTPTATATATATASPQPTVASVAPPPAAGSPSPPALAAYDPTSEPKKVVQTQVAAFTLLALGAGGGLAVTSSVSGVAAHESRKGGGGPRGGKVQSAKVKHVAGPLGPGGAPGDRSWTWRLPGTRWMDAASLALPVRLATRSPLLARIIVDGSFLRSMVGSATAILYLGGIGLGVAAVQSVSGHALPPAAAITIAVAVLAIFDALAGMLAALTFIAGVALLGGIDSAAAARTLLGLAALWTVVPLVAAAARPLRRAPAHSLEERWDRGADLVIASLIGAWAVQKIVAGLPGLAGLALPVARSANAAAIAVLVALVVRMVAESIAVRFYPQRLSAVHPPKVPRSGPRQRLAATLLRSALFVFVVSVVVGPSWQLWLGTAFFVVPQVLSIYEHRFRNLPSVYRVLPRGLLKLVLMLFFGTWFGSLVVGGVHNHHDAIADAFVILALPGLALSLLDLFARDGYEAPQRWWHRIAGCVVFAAGVLLVAGVIG